MWRHQHRLHKNSTHVNIVRTFFEKNKLEIAWKNSPIDFTYTYSDENRTVHSTVDHFAFSEELSTKIIESGVLHLNENRSDHEPIYMVLNIENASQLLNSNKKVNSSENIKKASWNNFNEDQKHDYKELLSNKLKESGI